MTAYFCLSVRFLNPLFHGRLENEEPEWPPSPFRAFQALVASAARRHAAGETEALQWLERQATPLVIASAANPAKSGYRLSVPNNAMDIVARKWAQGNYSNSGDANPATHRTMKTVRPMLLSKDEAVYYLWPFEENDIEDSRAHIDGVQNAASSIAALGWGVDMAIGHGAVLSQEEVDALPGERWLPGLEDVEDALRVPRDGTLKDLTERHSAFVERIGKNGFIPPPSLRVFRRVAYRRATDPEPRPVAAFALRHPDGRSGFRAFNTVRQGLQVAGMLRHAAKLAQKNGRPPDSFICGHAEKRGERHESVGPHRFAYLPLPSIESRGEGKAAVVGSIRRALLTVFTSEHEEELAWARRSLPGQELIREDAQTAVALLSELAGSDTTLNRYTRPSSTWATVTPVVLPGFDDPAHYRRRLRAGVTAKEQIELLEKLYDRVDKLLRKAITQAGFSEELAKHAQLEWRKAGFLPGTELADRYGVPDHLKRFPRYHVMLRWCDALGKPVNVSGPICLGGGRFYGIGLMVQTA